MSMGGNQFGLGGDTPWASRGMTLSEGFHLWERLSGLGKGPQGNELPLGASRLMLAEDNLLAVGADSPSE